MEIGNTICVFCQEKNVLTKEMLKDFIEDCDTMDRINALFRDAIVGEIVELRVVCPKCTKQQQE